MKEALSESTIGATLIPAMPISRVCWAGKKAQAERPQTTIATRTGPIATALVRRRRADRQAREGQRKKDESNSDHGLQGRSLSVRGPPSKNPSRPESPHTNSTALR